LLGMQERVSLVNGTILVDSSPGGGTTLRVFVPLPLENNRRENHPTPMGLQPEPT